MVEKETNSSRFCYIRVGGCGQLVCLVGNGSLLHVGLGPYVQGVGALAEERPMNTQSNYSASGQLKARRTQDSVLGQSGIYYP